MDDQARFHIGVAVVTTVAIWRTDDYLAVHTGASPLAALTEGLQSAFLAVAILAGIGGARALLTPRQTARHPAGQLELEPSRAGAGDLGGEMHDATTRGGAP